MAEKIPIPRSLRSLRYMHVGLHLSERSEMDILLRLSQEVLVDEGSESLAKVSYLARHFVGRLGDHIRVSKHLVEDALRVREVLDVFQVSEVHAPLMISKEDEEFSYLRKDLSRFKNHVGLEDGIKEQFLKLQSSPPIFNILVAFLLPHSTYILQPMDLGVFQPLKNAHQKMLREALRKGNLTFNRRDFAGSFKEIFEGFIAAHIIACFKKSGIFPPTEVPAVSYVLKKKLKTRKAIDPALSSLLPAENRFPLASDTARDVSNRYHDILSSPTRRGLEAVQKIVSETIVLEDIVKKHVADRQERIKKRYHQRKRGKQGKPVGDYFHSISLEELEQQAEFIEVGAKAEQRSQLRHIRSFAIRQMEEIKAEWQQQKEVIVDGVDKKMRFKQWLEHTKRDIEYASLDASRAEISSQLKKKED
ncbi:hypothetical protein FMUND_15616 [Fusarium mundagurra]|uniref:Uncharacterized protein n=1 Tax=Fusarium mundagurra TaxID=1567541 RepID=A0A8H6CYA6_9HYPO|nr:hypothetical protein FMUND_15616 [Fusarium mundagurra]